jgi:uncharacterized protein (TIGR03067 family)
MGRRVVVLGAALVFGLLGFASAEDKKPDAKKADDQKALQGTWTYESVEWNGKPVPADQIKTTTLTFEGDKYTIKVSGKVTMAGTIKFDASKTPKAFDATVTEGEGKGGTLLGIYKIDGDTVTACWKLQGNERPKEFKTTEQSETVLVVVKKAKK